VHAGLQVSAFSGYDFVTLVNTLTHTNTQTDGFRPAVLLAQTATPAERYIAATDGSAQEGISFVNQFCSEETAQGWQRIDNAGSNKKVKTDSLFHR